MIKIEKVWLGLYLNPWPSKTVSLDAKTLKIAARYIAYSTCSVQNLADRWDLCQIKSPWAYLSKNSLDLPHHHLSSAQNWPHLFTTGVCVDKLICKPKNLFRFWGLQKCVNELSSAFCNLSAVERGIFWPVFHQNGSCTTENCFTKWAKFHLLQLLFRA